MCDSGRPAGRRARDARGGRAAPRLLDQCDARAARRACARRGAARRRSGGGLEDLSPRRLRILHPKSFHDDPTRAWRAARFATRLGFRLDRPSRAALRSALRDGAFGAVSGERFRRELEFVFAEAREGAHAGKILRLLDDWHVLGALEPGLALGSDRLVPLRRLSKVTAEPDWPAPRWRSWQAGLAIWLAPHPAALRRRTLERFAVRGETAKRIVEFGRTGERTLRGLAKARGRGAVDATLSGLPEETVQALYAIADLPVRKRILRWAAEDRRRRPPVSGGDLVEAGLEGPLVGKALARIRTGFLDGEIANREEALALAQSRSPLGPARDGVETPQIPAKSGVREADCGYCRRRRRGSGAPRIEPRSRGRDPVEGRGPRDRANVRSVRSRRTRPLPRRRPRSRPPPRQGMQDGFDR